MGALQEDVSTFITASRWIFLRTRNISDKDVEKIKTHILRSVEFLPRKSCLVWDNVEKCCTARQATDDTIWRMPFACWITKARDTHPEYVIFIGFPLQQWLPERASINLTEVQLYGANNVNNNNTISDTVIWYSEWGKYVTNRKTRKISTHKQLNKQTTAYTCMT
jgi:hypothetical protein